MQVHSLALPATSLLTANLPFPTGYGPQPFVDYIRYLDFLMCPHLLYHTLITPWLLYQEMY